MKYLIIIRLKNNAHGKFGDPIVGYVNSKEIAKELCDGLNLLFEDEDEYYCFEEDSEHLAEMRTLMLPNMEYQLKIVEQRLNNKK